MQLYLGSEKPCVPVEAYCKSQISTKSLESLLYRSERNTGIVPLFTSTIFTLLRALGKYESLQLTLKTIAQTTALRQKDINYFCGCYMIVSVLPTFIVTTFGKVDKFRKAFDSLSFHLIFSKLTMNGHILL